MGAKNKSPPSTEPSGKSSLSQSPVFFTRNNSMTKSMSKKPSNKFLVLKNQIEKQLVPKFPDQALTNLKDQKKSQSSGTIPKALSIPQLCNTTSKTASNGSCVKPNIQSIHEALFKKSLDMIKRDINMTKPSGNNSSTGSSEKKTKESKETLGANVVKTNKYRATLVNVKPKMIDLEFKNELEKLFAGGNPMESRARAHSKNKPQSLTSVDKDKASSSSLKKSHKSSEHSVAMTSKLEVADTAMEADKLRNIFSVISGHSISDYSDLLVDFKDNAMATESTEQATNDNNANFILQNPSKLKSLDNDKLVQYLIQILVKSCRVFDVATTADGSSMSYWRYANPIVAAYRSSNDAKKQRKSGTQKLVDSSTQASQGNESMVYSTNTFYSGNNTAATVTNSCQPTIIENRLLVKVGTPKNSNSNDNSTTTDNRSLAQSIIEILTDTLSFKNKNRLSCRLKKYRMDKGKATGSGSQETESNSNNTNQINCKYTSFSGSVSSSDLDEDDENDGFLELYDEDFSDSDSPALSTKSITSKTSKNKTTNKLQITTNSTRSMHKNNNNKPMVRLRSKVNKNLRHYFRKFRLQHPTPQTSSPNAYQQIYRHNNNSSNFFQQRLRRSVFLNSSNRSHHRAQDETLRDAENLSDIDNELDIDQWADLTTQNNNNTKDSNHNEASNHSHHALKSNLNSSSSFNRNRNSVATTVSSLAAMKNSNLLLDAIKKKKIVEVREEEEGIEKREGIYFDINKVDSKVRARKQTGLLIVGKKKAKQINRRNSVLKSQRRRQTNCSHSLHSDRATSTKLINNRNNSKYDRHDHDDDDNDNGHEIDLKGRRAKVEQPNPFRRLNSNYYQEEEYITTTTRNHRSQKNLKNEQKRRKSLLLSSSFSQVTSHTKTGAKKQTKKHNIRTHIVNKSHRYNKKQKSYIVSKNPQTKLPVLIFRSDKTYLAKRTLPKTKRETVNSKKQLIRFPRMDTSTNMERTASADSLEELPTTETNNKQPISDIKMNFEYSSTQGATAAPAKSQHNLENDQKDLKFDQDAVKERTRAGLKFWQQQEGEKKQKSSEPTLNNKPKFAYNQKPQITQPKPLKQSVTQSAALSKPVQSESYNREFVVQAEDSSTTQTSTNRVKDRISVFETKRSSDNNNNMTTTTTAMNQGHSTTTSSAASHLGLKKPSFIAKPVHSTKKFPLVELHETEVITRTVFTEHNNVRRVSQATFEAPQQQQQHQQAAETPSSTRMTNSRSLGSDLNQKDATRIPIYLSGASGGGSKVQAARSNPNLTASQSSRDEENYRHGHYQSQDDNDNNKNEDETMNVIVDVVQRFNAMEMENNGSQTNVSEIVVNNKSYSTTHLLHDRPESQHRQQPGKEIGTESESSLEMDEVEIIIDLNSYHEARKIEAIDERLRNIVMHMIPTTRKAYVDDICDGIKAMLDTQELEQIRSPIDLPNQVIKFVQKRYSSLLNECDLGINSATSSSTEQQTESALDSNLGNHGNQTKQEQIYHPQLEHAEGDDEIVTETFEVDVNVESTTTMDKVVEAQPKVFQFEPMRTTTELTMIKEIQFDESCQEEDPGSVKVDEDTLYIVEKKRNGLNYNIVPVEPKLQQQQQLKHEKHEEEEEEQELEQEVVAQPTRGSSARQEPSINPAADQVDHEIRKNFELKPKPQQDQNEQYTSNLSALISALRASISDQTRAEMVSNDYQLHYFDSATHHLSDSEENTESDSEAQGTPIKKVPVLTMFIESREDANYKFSLEQKYHKSIVETHAMNEKKEVNIVATFNILYTPSDTEISNDLGFGNFSLINPPKSKDDIRSISLHKIFNSFPIGKFFAQLNYYSAETGHAKQLLIDISLLPLQIRSTIVHEFEALFGKKSHHHEVYPTFSLLVIDVSMAQAEKHKLIQSIFAKRLEQFDEIGDQLRHSFAKHPFEFLAKMKSDLMPSANPYLDQFVKQLDIDLNSFYLCEQVIDKKISTVDAEQNKPSLIKLNKLDALAYFDSCQLFDRYAEHLFDADPSGLCNLNTQTKVKETKLDEKIFSSHGNFFYIISYGKLYKCLVPITDLPISQESKMHQSNDQFIKSVENLQHNSSLIVENVHKRQNFIFSRHLMNVPPYKNYGSMANLIMNFHEQIATIKLRELIEPEQEEVEELAKLEPEYEDDETENKWQALPSFSESGMDTATSEVGQNQQQRLNGGAYIEDIEEEDEEAEAEEERRRERMLMQDQREEEEICAQQDTDAQMNAYGLFDSLESARYDAMLGTEYTDINEHVNQLQQMTLNLNKSQVNQEMRNLSEVEFASFETDRLKQTSRAASRSRLQTGGNSAIMSNSCDQLMSKLETRDQVIIKEIDRLFASIRDHQGANAKAHGELEQLPGSQLKRSGSWGYSSSKRHVKAKVMDMPYAEDYTSVAKKLGISASTLNYLGSGLRDAYISSQGESGEKVFVRIDDYLNREVSRALERSYSADYLNQCACARARISYVRIPPGQENAQTQAGCADRADDTLNFEACIANTAFERQQQKFYQKHREEVEEEVNANAQFTEYRSAPYDLRYWSILKLLEEERQQKERGNDKDQQAQVSNAPITDQLLSMHNIDEGMRQLEQNMNSSNTQQQEQLSLDSNPQLIENDKNNISFAHVTVQQRMRQPAKPQKKMKKPEIQRKALEQGLELDTCEQIIIKEKTTKTTKKAVLKKIDDELDKIEQDQDKSSSSSSSSSSSGGKQQKSGKVKSKTSFKNGFKIIDRLFGTNSKSSAEKALSKQQQATRQISESPEINNTSNSIHINFTANFRNSSSQLNTYQELPFQPDNVHLTSYSQTNMDVSVNNGVDVSSSSQVSTTNNKKSKFTIVDRLQNLIPSNSSSDRQQQKKNF